LGTYWRCCGRREPWTMACLSTRNLCWAHWWNCLHGCVLAPACGSLTHLACVVVRSLAAGVCSPTLHLCLITRSAWFRVGPVPRWLLAVLWCMCVCAQIAPRILVATDVASLTAVLTDCGIAFTHPNHAKAAVFGISVVIESLGTVRLPLFESHAGVRGCGLCFFKKKSNRAGCACLGHAVSPRPLLRPPSPHCLPSPVPPSGCRKVSAAHGTTLQPRATSGAEHCRALHPLKLRSSSGRGVPLGVSL
jgi:hypothetical protein